MNDPSPATAISPLRQRLIDDMNVRRFSRETQRNYIRDVGRFATFLRRSPDTATADDVRRFQIEQRDAGVPTPTMNSISRRCGSSSRTPSTGLTWRATRSYALKHVRHGQPPQRDAGTHQIAPHDRADCCGLEGPRWIGEGEEHLGRSRWCGRPCRR